MAVGCGFIGFHYGLSLIAVVLVLYLAVIIHLILVDLEYSLIRNSVMLTVLVVVVATLPFRPLNQELGLGGTYLHSLVGAGVGIAIMLLAHPISNGRIGAGEVKLAALLGLMFGFQHVFAGLTVGLVCVSMVAAGLVVLKLRGQSDAIPMRPVLLGGTVAVLFSASGIYSLPLWVW